MARNILPAAAMAAMGFLGAIYSPSTAWAQPQCGERGNVLSTLATRYQEFPVHMGLTSSGAMLEIVATESGSTWSIIVTGRDGVTCLVSAGENWRPVDFLPGEPS